MLKNVLDFLFGKDPEIFNAKGEVEHQLPQEKWQAWQDRYLKGDEYNWRNHTGTRLSDKTSSQSHGASGSAKS